VKGLPRVKLIGKPSGGGSGAYVETTLRSSGLLLRLSSMASFQQSGRLFDGRGVEPDLPLEPVPEYYLRGGPAPVLEAAVQRILGR
jgi:C-terminal processing protease CtpA/Prc